MSVDSHASENQSSINQVRKEKSSSMNSCGLLSSFTSTGYC